MISVVSRVYLDSVIPEKSGIQGLFPLDSRLRGKDENARLFMGHDTGRLPKKVLLLMACLLFAGLATGAPVAAQEASSPAGRLLPELEGTRGGARYVRLAEAAAALDERDLAEALAAGLETNRWDAVQRRLLVGLLLGLLVGPVEGRQPPEERPAVGGALGERVASIAVRLSGDPDWRVRLAAAELLEIVGSARTIDSQRALADDPVWPVRHRAIASLGLPPAGENAGLLAGLLGRKDETYYYERIEAIRALGRLANLPGLLAGLADPYPEVQLNAVWGLSRLKILPAGAVRALEQTRRQAASPAVKQEIDALLGRQRELPPGEKP